MGMKGIITLCGSTKFKEQFEQVQKDLTLADYIVLTVGCFYHTFPKELEAVIETHKEQLDRLHKEKIALAQAVVIIDVDGYIGKSTSSELEYALSLNKEIYVWEDLEYPKYSGIVYHQIWRDLIDQLGGK